MIEFFFDCSSPWTYLAFHNIQPLAKEFGAEIVWRPILVGGIFNSINPSVYATREHPVPVKVAYQKKDMADGRARRGLPSKCDRRYFRSTASRRCGAASVWARTWCRSRARCSKSIGARIRTFRRIAVLPEVCKPRRRRSAKVPRRHRRAGDQGSAQGQHRRGDGARRLRLADHLHRPDRYVLRQRPAAAGPRGAGRGQASAA